MKVSKILFWSWATGASLIAIGGAIYLIQDKTCHHVIRMISWDKGFSDGFQSGYEAGKYSIK